MLDTLIVAWKYRSTWVLGIQQNVHSIAKETNKQNTKL